MDYLFGVEWRHVFMPETPLLEIFARGTITYLGLFLMLRLVLKRERGNVALTDLLVVVLLADAAQNAMGDDYRSIPDGLLLVATIIFWNYFLDWLGFRIPALNRLLAPPPLQVIRDGELIRANLRKELIADDELMRMLRKQGVDDVSQVEKAYIEGDGQLSVFTKGERRGTNAPRDSGPGGGSG